MGLNLKPFLRQPAIMPDEFLLSYLIRLAEANSYDSMETFRSVIHEHSSMYGAKDTLYNPVRAETYSVLSKLCGIRDSELFQHTIHKFADIFIPCTEKQDNIAFSDGSVFHLADHETHRRNCRPHSNTAFCPECLKESAYYRLGWHILSTTACLKHNVLLIDSCQQCGNSLSVGEIVNYRCSKCQFDLRTSDTINIEQDSLSYKTQKILSGWMGICEPTDIIPGVSPVILYRVFTGLKYCIQTKVDWGYLHPFPDYFATKSSRMELAKWVVPNKYLHRLNVTAVKALLNFPNGMYEFWDAYKDINYQGNIAQGLGYLYWGWIEKRWSLPEYDFIQEAYNEYLVTREEILTPAIAKSQRLLNHPELKNRFKYITLATAAGVLQTYKWSVQNLVKSGNIGGKAIDKGKDKFVVLLKDVQSIFIKLNSSVDLLTTTKLLGTTKTVVLSLVRNGLLESVKSRTSDDSSHWFITVDSITELQEQIIKSVKIKNKDNTCTKKLPNVARQLAGWGVEMSDILKHVLDGKIEGYLENENVVTLDSLYLPDNSDLIIKDEIIKNNGWITNKEFAKRIGVKPTIVYRWVRSGLIKSAKVISGTAYFTVESIAEFESAIITTKDAANILNVGVLTVQRWARLGRLIPVSGTEIDGCHEYRFKREDVEAISKEKRLTAPEMAKALGISRTSICVWIKQGKLKPVSGPGIDGMKHYLFSP